MSYVDGFVIPLPERNVDAYRRLARKASKVWLDHGALEYRECVLEDGQGGPMVPFTKAARAREGETVVFAWILFHSRAHRDRVNAKVMADPRLAKMMASGEMPFDVKRLVYGGFRTIVEA